MNKVFTRIVSNGPGWVFTPRDFLDLGSRVAIDHALSRLYFQNKIRRLTRGTYDYPKKHPLIGILSPDPYNIARAVAKRKNIKLQVSGAYSANLLGLSEQVPAKIVFLTDGNSEIIKIGNIEIQFKHARPSRLIGAESLAGTIIQAIQYLNKDNITSDIIQKIKKQMLEKDKIELKNYKLDLPGWMQPIIDQIIKK